MGFAVDSLIELTSTISCFIVLTTVGSLYVGLCLYINGMVADMRTRVDSAFASHKEFNKMDQWAVILKEIDFHNEIIEYVFESRFMRKI